jgi:hypothetical protein
MAASKLKQLFNIKSHYNSHRKRFASSSTSSSSTSNRDTNSSNSTPDPGPNHATTSAPGIPSNSSSSTPSKRRQAQSELSQSQSQSQSLLESESSSSPASNSSANRKRSSTYPSIYPSTTRSSTSSSSPASPSSSRRQSPSPPPTNRGRLNSREIPRTYSGLYGIGGGHELEHQTQTPASDLLPFELSRNYNTNWLHSYPNSDLHHNNTNYLRNNIMSSSLFWIYIFFIVFVEFALVVLPLPIMNHHVEISFTITNVLHGIITIIFLHWLKGSPNFYDYGELNALTLWEQLSCSPESNLLANQTKQVLYIAPTLLCYIGCKFVNFDLWLSLINLGVWTICIVAKLEGMHGVRLFGWNRTIGIDDDFRKSN